MAMLLLVLMQMVSRSEAVSECAQIPPQEDGDIVETLWHWCLESATCRGVYHQPLDSPNVTVFRHLAPPTLLGPADQYGQARHVMCAKYSIEDVNKELWVTNLIAHRRTLAPLCDVNHEPRFDAATLRSTCVCRADRVCSDSIYDMVPFYVALGLFITASVVFIAGSIYKNIKLLTNLRERSRDPYADLNILKTSM